MWRFHLVDTNTGVKHREVYPKSGRWRTVANGAGDGEHNFSLVDPATKLAPNVWRDMTVPWAVTLVVSWNDSALYAGLIMRHTWNAQTGTLSVSHREVRAIATRRMLYGVGPYDPFADIVIENKSNRGLARSYVFYALINGTPRWQLPIVLPDDEAGGWTERIERWRFRTLEDLLRSVQEADGGPDIHFQPRWTSAGKLEWVLMLGTPRLTATSIEVNVTAPESPVVGFQQVTDAAQQLTGLWGLGEGSGPDMLVSPQPLPDGGRPIPFLDTSRPFKDIKEQARLDTMSAESMRSSREPTVQWTFGLRGAEWMPRVGVGTSVRWHHMGDAFMERTPDGGRVSYVVGVSGDMSLELGLELQ